MRSPLQSLVLITLTAFTCLTACSHDELLSPSPAQLEESDTLSQAADIAPDDQHEENQDEMANPEATNEPDAEDGLELSDKFDSGLQYSGVNGGSSGNTDPLDHADQHNQRATFGN